MKEDQNVELKENWRDEFLKWISSFANAQGGILCIDKSMEMLLSKYLKATIHYEGVQRIERYPVPEEALREALLNAVAHKDYNSNTPTQIRVYDDRIQFWNSGQLHEGWKIEDITEEHNSQPFNPDVARILSNAGMIEAWGHGIEKMIKSCKHHGVPEPTFSYERSGILVEFSGIQNTQASEKTSVKTSVKASVKTSVKIVSMMRENPHITIKEIAGALGKSVRSIEMQVTKLKNDNAIKRVGSARSGHWEVIE